MLINGLLLTLYILRWSLELLLIYIEVPVPNHQNSSSWFGNCSQSVVGIFYILSQQLDNLEHSAHLYGQLTTVGLFTTFGQFTTIWPCTTFELSRFLFLFNFRQKKNVCVSDCHDISVMYWTYNKCVFDML